MTGFDPTQTPLWQVSVCVQPLLSLQVVLLAAAAQAPVADTQTLHVPQAAPAFCRVPLVSQVCGWLPLQIFEPGVQLPEQTPPVLLQT